MMRRGPRQDLHAVAPDWEDLAERVGANPFVRPGWVEAWWRAFGRGALQIATARDSGELVGVLPVRRRAGAVGSPTNWHTPVFGPVVRDRGAAASLFEGVLSDRPRRLSLSFLDAEDCAVAAFGDSAAAARYWTATRTRLRSPYIALDSGDEDPAGRLGGKRRREMRRRRRLLKERGALTFEVSDGSEGLEASLKEGFAIEALGWKGRRETAIASNPATLRFYTDVAKWAAARSSLRLCFLRLDGRGIAFDYALEEGGVHYLVKTGYDPAYRAHGPGVLLRHEAVSRAARLGLKSYEFLGGPDPMKLEWTDAHRQRIVVQAFRRSPGGAVDRMVLTHGRNLVAHVRDKVRR